MKCSRIELLLVLGLGPISAWSYSFTTLMVPFPGATQTHAYKINDLGAIVGWWLDSSSPVVTGGAVQGFVFQNGAYTAIEVPGAITTSAFGINIRGDIVGMTTVIGDQPFGTVAVDHGFILQGGMFTTFDFPGYTCFHCQTVAFGNNSRGEIVGWYLINPDGLAHGFLRERDHFTTIDVPFPGFHYTLATGINDRGDIVGTYSENGFGPVHGFLKEGSIFHSIDVPFSGRHRHVCICNQQEGRDCWLLLRYLRGDARVYPLQRSLHSIGLISRRSSRNQRFWRNGRNNMLRVWLLSEALRAGQ